MEHHHILSLYLATILHRPYHITTTSSTTLERIEEILKLLREIFELDLLYNLDLDFYEQTTSLDLDFEYEPFYDSDENSIPELVQNAFVFTVDGKVVRQEPTRRVTRGTQTREVRCRESLKYNMVPITPRLYTVV